MFNNKILTTATLLIILIITSSCKKENNTTEVAQTPSTSDSTQTNYSGSAGIPSFPISLVNGGSLNTSDLKGNVTLIFFSPDCDHCQTEAKTINASKNLFRNKVIYFISIDEIEAITKFRDNYGLNEPNFHFAKSDVELIVRAIGPISSVPAMYFYKEGKLAGQLEGEQTAEKLADQM